MKNSKKAKNINLGSKGEKIAALSLQKKKYRILKTNYRTKFGEIDIIAKDPIGTLVFVEVKTLSGKLDPLRSLLPEDNLSGWKMHKLQRICQFFANAFPALVEKRGWQIDLVAVIFESRKKCTIRHYKNL